MDITEALANVGGANTQTTMFLLEMLIDSGVLQPDYVADRIRDAITKQQAANPIAHQSLVELLSFLESHYPTRPGGSPPSH